MTKKPKIYWLYPFADKLKTLMRSKGMSQKELANKTGLSSAIISMYANATACPSDKNISKLAAALGCSVEELVYFSEYGEFEYLKYDTD